MLPGEAERAACVSGTADGDEARFAARGGPGRQPQAVRCDRIPAHRPRASRRPWDAARGRRFLEVSAPGPGSGPGGVGRFVRQLNKTLYRGTECHLRSGCSFGEAPRFPAPGGASSGRGALLRVSTAPRGCASGSGQTAVKRPVGAPCRCWQGTNPSASPTTRRVGRGGISCSKESKNLLKYIANFCSCTGTLCPSVMKAVSFCRVKNNL